MNDTALDLAFVAMADAPEDDAARIKYLHTLADTELIVHLKDQPDGEQITPETLTRGAETYVVAFDGFERLVEHSGDAAEYAALPGRKLSEMLAGQGIGVAVNPGQMGAYLVSANVLDWLNTALDQYPTHYGEGIGEVLPIAAGSEVVIRAVEAKLAPAAGLVAGAVVARTRDDDGTLSNFVAFLDAVPGTEAALAGAVNEAVVFAGSEDNWIVGHFRVGTEIARRLTAVGRAVEFPVEPAPQPPKPTGSDPSKPPILR